MHLRRLQNKLHAFSMTWMAPVWHRTFDDISFNSRSEEEHTEHLRIFSELLRKQKLYAKGSQGNIGQNEVDLLE